MISVIVPVYNVKPYIKEAIDSLLSQTYSDMEIILVDDGSTDGSSRICDEYAEKDSRILVIHQSNRGLSAARNVGLDCCHGELIAFLDPDDSFCGNMLFVMEEAMRASGADIVECNYSKYEGNAPMNPQEVDDRRVFRVPFEGIYPVADALRIHLNFLRFLTLNSSSYTPQGPVVTSNIASDKSDKACLIS